jgi:hypothetical protein
MSIFWDMAREYHAPDNESEVLCERCPFRVKILTIDPPESEKPILDQVRDLRVDYCNLHQIPDPHARQEQVMLIMGYNHALSDVAKLLVRGIPQIVEKMDGTCLDDEADRERFIKALYGADKD